MRSSQRQAQAAKKLLIIRLCHPFEILLGDTMEIANLHRLGARQNPISDRLLLGISILPGRSRPRQKLRQVPLVVETTR